MTNFSIETRLYFDCNEKAHEERLHLAKYLSIFDSGESWHISVRTLHWDVPSIVLTYPITEAVSVARALTLWEETKDDRRYTQC